MKMLQVFFGVGAVIALLVGVAVAEIKNESMKPLMFSVDVGDGSVTLPDFTFCNVGSTGDEGAQATCMMTPGGNMPNSLLELPVTPVPVAASAEDYTSAQVAIAPVAQLNSIQPPVYGPRRPWLSNPDDPSSPAGPADLTDPVIVDPADPSPVVVPEPATLVIVGLGIGGAMIARRRRQG